MFVEIRRVSPRGRRLAVLLAWTGGGACAGGARVAEPAPVADACAVVPVRPAVSAGAVVLGVAGSIDPANAPVPRTPAEVLVFAQLYDGLVRIDCAGRVEPAIAESWSSEASGRGWTFRVRADVRDWRGEVVTAESVATSWSARRAASPDLEPNVGAPPAIEQLTVMDARTLRVVFAGPVTIDHFARPELWVTTGDGADGWPIGTGAYRPGTAGEAGGPEAAPRARPGGGAAPLHLTGPTTLEVRTISGDARDALDAGVDLMVTRDPAVIDYADASPAFAAVPLAWDRAYVLLTRAASRPSDSDSPSPEPSAPGPDLRVLTLPVPGAAQLARDAVRVDARAPDHDEAHLCSAEGARPGGAARSPARRIVYPASDPVAGALAERLVALALAPRRPESAWLFERVPDLTRGGRVAAAALPSEQLDETLSAGADVAYVLSIPRGERAAVCDVARAAAGRAPWLSYPGSSSTGEVPAVLPLLETRSTLLVREDVHGIDVDGRGVLRLDRMRRSPSGAAP